MSVDSSVESNLTWWSWASFARFVSEIHLTQGSKARNFERKRTCTLFNFQGHRVCRDTFVFLHTMSIARLKSIKQQWLENGLCPRSRPKVLPHNTTKLSDIKYAVRGTSFSTQRTTPFCFPAGYPATRGMICSFCHPRPQSGRCGISITLQLRRAKTRRQLATLSFVLFGGS